MLDLVVDRREMKAVIASALRFMGAAAGSRCRSRPRPSLPRSTETLASDAHAPPVDPLAYLFSSRAVRDQVRSRQHRGARRRASAIRSARSRSVHVAGTNGKGSVTAMVDAALRAAGHRIGALHVAASGRSQRAVRRSTAAGRPRRADRAPSPTSATRRSARRRRRPRRAADVFRSDDGARVRAVPPRGRRASAVLEVGLGGRLDATNVVHADRRRRSRRSRSITSSISATRCAEIATEKAGIIKPGVPVVVGPVAAGSAARRSGRSRPNAAPPSCVHPIAMPTDSRSVSRARISARTRA